MFTIAMDYMYKLPPNMGECLPQKGGGGGGGEEPGNEVKCMYMYSTMHTKFGNMTTIN